MSWSAGKIGGDRICKKLITMQIQVYVDIVPPFAAKCVKKKRYY